jgi:hypothetical protein
MDSRFDGVTVFILPRCFQFVQLAHTIPMELPESQPENENRRRHIRNNQHRCP